jgi:heterodisulfide reductase subunit A-like polyferredoxin
MNVMDDRPHRDLARRNLTAIGTPYKQVKLAERWDAIVIGSGIGGLTAAVLLAVHGGNECWCWSLALFL